MTHLVGGGSDLAWVSVKALLLYVTAVIGFRVGARRTLADMSAFDFVAAVAVGAIVGRVPNASDASYLAGAVTLVTLLVAHAVVVRLRHFPSVSDLVDHQPRLLVAHGAVLGRELRRAGLTERDLYAILRQRGVYRLSEVQFAIIEDRGRVSVVRTSDTDPDAPLLRDVLPRTAE